MPLQTRAFNGSTRVLASQCTSQVTSTFTSPAQSRWISDTHGQPKFSNGSDIRKLTKQLDDLYKGKRWSLSHDCEGIERVYKFKTWTQTWDFMTEIAMECKTTRHHPEWSNAHTTTFIRWKTHKPRGLSHKDLEMAAFCDAAAKKHDQVVLNHSPQKTESVQKKSNYLVGRAVSAAEGTDLWRKAIQKKDLLAKIEAETTAQETTDPEPTKPEMTGPGTTDLEKAVSSNPS